MWKALFVAMCPLVASEMAFSNELAKGQQVAQFIEFGQNEQGSILVVQDRQQIQQFQQEMSLPVQAQRLLVLVTGRTAMTIRYQMESTGHQVGQYGQFGQNQALVLTDRSAASFVQVMQHHYGESLPQAQQGVLVVKGGLNAFAEVTHDVFAGAVSLGMSIAHMKAHFIYVHVRAMAKAGIVLLHHAGYMLVKTTQGVFCLVRFAIGAVLQISSSVVRGTLLVAHHAVVGTFYIVQSVVRHLEIVLASLFNPVGNDHYQLVIAQN